MIKTISLFFIFLIISALLLVLPVIVSAQGPQIVIGTNYEGFLANSPSPLTLSLGITNPDTSAATVDAYIGFIFPGNQIYCFNDPNNLSSIVPCGTLEQLELVPIVSSLTLDPGLSFSTDNFVSTAPSPLASLPLQYGKYLAFAGFTQPSTLDVLSVSLANIYLTDNIEIGTSLGGVQLGSEYSQLTSLYNVPDSISATSNNMVLSANYTGIGLSFLVLDSDLSGTVEPSEKVVTIGAVSPYFGKTPGGSGIGSDRSTVEAEFGASSDTSVLFYPEVGMQFNLDTSNHVSEVFLLPPVESSSLQAKTKGGLDQSLWSIMTEAGLFPADLLDIINHHSSNY
jgi:hypothetical protein